MKKVALILVFILLGGFLAWEYFPTPLPAEWSEQELSLITSLSLQELAPLAHDPSNKFADDERAARFGQALYFDTRLSSNGTVACASCHKPELMYADGLELAIGLDIGPRHTPGLVGISHSPWFYWDGRKDSQWAQALAPLESAIEHDSDRLSVVRLLASDNNYRQQYEEIFGQLPDLSSLPAAASPLGNEAQLSAWKSIDRDTQQQITLSFSHVGKALAAYQRKIQPGMSRFDSYVEKLTSSNEIRQDDDLSSTELAGLQLFIGKGQCISCHNGPLFTNHEFHNTGILPVVGQLPSMGRYDGIRQARLDEFNCLGDFSDADASECIELRFARDENDLVGAQKTPTLRNVSLTAPYMHGGQLATLREVVEHYNDAPVSMLSHNEAKPLGLRTIELGQLEAFLHTLTAPLSTDPSWLKPLN